jgi:prepilin-type N-terminal cleavage/methylation domain-containing protein
VRSRGFTLLELSIVLIIGATFLMAMTLSQHVRMLQLRSQAMAQRYQSLQAGVLRYVELYRPQLLALPTSCSMPSYRAGIPKPPSGAVAAGSCTLKLKVQGRSVELRNALQPAPEELLALGLLDAGSPVSLALDRQIRVLNPAFASGTPGFAPDRLGILLRKVCDTQDCSDLREMQSLIYNLQPFLLDGGNWAFARADQVKVLINELGDGAAQSDAQRQGMLVGSVFTQDNPVQEENGLGMPGIVALRASTNMVVDAAWARRDGQSAISGDWNFSSHQIQGVSSLGVQSVQARDLELSGNAALNAASARSMEVQRLQAQNLRLPSVLVGQVCDPALSNVALDSDSAKVLTCSTSNPIWTPP